MVCCHLVLHTKKKNHQNKGGFRTEQGYCSGSGSHESTYCGRLEQEKPEPMVDRDDEGELGDEEKEVMSEVSVDGRSSFVCNLSQQLGSFSRKSLCSAQAAAGPTFFLFSITLAIHEYRRFHPESSSCHDVIGLYLSRLSKRRKSSPQFVLWPTLQSSPP